MSHFSVLVVGEDPEHELAPFHEYECSGRHDEFVVHQDVTEDARAIYERETSDERGEFTVFCEEYYGAEVIAPGEAPPKASYCQTGEDGVTRMYRYTNPNAQWDWWVMGGRWRGMLRLKAGTEGADGEPGIFDRGEKRPGYCDQARKKDIDIDGIRQEAAEAAALRYDELRRVLGDATWETWEEVRERFGEGKVDEARSFYNAQEPVKLAYADEKTRSMIDFMAGIDPFRVPRQQYIDERRASAFSTFAFVKDRKWTERGSMGWFGMTSGEVSMEEWLTKFNEFVDSLGDDELLTIVDCHI